MNKQGLLLFIIFTIVYISVMPVQSGNSFYEELLQIDNNGFGSALWVEWQPNGNFLAISYDETSDITILDAHTGNLIYTLQTPSRVAPSLGVTDLAWSPDGLRLAAAFEDDAVNIWNFANNRVDDPIVIEFAGRVPFLTWRPDGTQLAVAWGGNADDREILIFASDNGRLITRFGRNIPKIAEIAWSPDGNKLLAYTWDYQLLVWDIYTRKEITRFADKSDDKSIMGIGVWTFDSENVIGVRCNISVDGCSLWKWNLASGEVSNFFEIIDVPLTKLVTLQLSPDEKLLTATGMLSVYFWDMSDGKLLNTIHNEQFVRDITWSPDSQKIAVIDTDITIWKIKRI
jgi:WD40 repeat protein